MADVDIGSRKDEHLEIAASEDVEAAAQTTWLEHVHLVHRALPGIDLGDVDPSVELFGKKLKLPILMDSMTGGSEMGAKVNGDLASVAAELGIGMGVGSQRAALRDGRLRSTYSVVRDVAPDILVYANIGAQQLAEVGVDGARACVDMVRADALAVHLNPLQEAIQPEGDPRYRGVVDRIAEVVDGVGVPVIVKEVGSGLSREVVALLESVGVRAFDVAGVGGTSWARIESIRASRSGATGKARLGDSFRDWGIPTAASVIEARSATGRTVIASGGIRSGLDVAKSIAIGADAAAMALPALRALTKGGRDALRDYISSAADELRLAMFLTGSRSIADLRRARYVLSGELADWARGLGSIRDG
ncbi:MAG: type 2 isopentenyl-diphosphate Delta-isomerase [Nitrososphaeria archaeon]|jgi:isopentenyl-diphosphate delta-isomerase